MNILTVNTGSSSVRLALFEAGDSNIDCLSRLSFSSKEGMPDALLRRFLAGSGLPDISAVSHRVVHGGMRFVESCLIESETEHEIEKLSSLAPLHNPVALKWIRTCRDVLGSAAPQIAVFDTAFYSAMPDKTKTYALPKSLCDEHGIRRYGFHGIAHRAMCLQWRELRTDLDNGGRTISLQLGSGCSVTAIENGRPLDTSMGFSPLEGLMMSTRSGDIDPGVLLYLQKSAGFSADEIDIILNKSSGLLGVSGTSSDMRELLNTDTPEARLAIDMYCYRAKKYIGAYMASLGGADGIVFGGGVGENAPVIRQKILEGMQWCGIDLDDKRNNRIIGNGGRISSDTGMVDLRVIQVDEAMVLAQEAIALIS